MAERLCKECEGLIVTVAAIGPAEDWDLDLMCVVCGAALSLGGLLEGEWAAADEDRLAG